MDEHTTAEKKAEATWDLFRDLLENSEFVWDAISLTPILEFLNEMKFEDKEEILAIMWGVWQELWNSRKVIRLSPEDYIAELIERSTEQRTEKWYEVRKETLNASTFHRIVGTVADWDTMMIEKINSTLGVSSKFSSASCDWGVRYEPIAKKIYEIKTGQVIIDVGYIVHDRYRVGASPDGITVLKNGDLRLIEIKCKYSKDITGSILYDYWVQMQVQMEVCDVDECDFIELKFKEEEFTEDSILKHPDARFYGVRVQIRSDSTTEPVRDAISEMGLTIDELREFVDKSTTGSSDIIEKVDFWYLESIDICLVFRNRMWWKSCIPNIELFWTQYEENLKTGVSHLEAKKKKRPRLLPGSLIVVSKLEEESPIEIEEDV